MPRATVSLSLIAIAAAVVNARPTFVQRIPNGSGVTGVAALGHVNPAGGGANNDFGLAFKSAGEEWTQVLCMEDSDGDGQTNGQELGDPCCEWIQDSNAVVRWSDGVSHPGDASSTSDASLWADIICTNTNSSTMSSMSGSTDGNVDAGSPIAPTSGGGTTPSADTPTDSTSSSATTTMNPAVYSAVGAAAAIGVFLM